MTRQWISLLAVVMLTIVITLIYFISLKQNNWRPIINFSIDHGTAEPDANDIYIDDSESKRLAEEVTVFCWILSTREGLSNKAAAVNYTWASRCSKHVFIVSASSAGSVESPTIPQSAGSTSSMDMTMAKQYVDGLGITFNVLNQGDVVYIDSPDGWGKLTEKSREILSYVFQTELNKYDWFIKGDDDTYIIMENLRYLLSQFDKSKPLYLGYHLEPNFYSSPYMSGGAGYVFSNTGLKTLVEKGLNVKGACQESGSFEDVEIGRCASTAGVSIAVSTDKFERETFHPDRITDFIPGPPLDWLNMYARNKPKGGSDCCSQFSISFHRLSPQEILVLDHLLYRTSVYGRHVPKNIPQFHKTGTVKKRSSNH